MKSRSPHKHGETKSTSPTSSQSASRGLWSRLLVIVPYLLVFFSIPFEPYGGLGDGTPSRASFFSYLLLPDEYFAAWAGPDGVSLWDRIPILAVSFVCLLSAYGWGRLVLAATVRKNRLNGLEVRLFSAATGLGLVSMLLSLFFFFNSRRSFEPPWIVSLTILLGGLCCALFFEIRSQNSRADSKEASWTYLKRSTFFFVLPVFTILLVLGGMIPSTDYDVLSYHLAGAREFAEAGRIGFLTDNVYANMPFGAEMFTVWGIALLGDPFRGAMVGKTLIAWTTVLTGLGLYAFGRRFFTEAAGLVAMILYLGTPWILYVSTAGLVDSVVGMYAFFAIYAASIRDRRLSGVFLAGFLAGSAAACKYPAMLFVVLPLGFYVAFENRGRLFHGCRTLAVFALAVLISCGGWYVKNYCYTGNPVYPLCWSVLGDSTGSWNTEVETRWKQAHSPHGFGLATLVADVWRVGMTSPWNGPLVIPFCLLGLCWTTNPKDRESFSRRSATNGSGLNRRAETRIKARLRWGVRRGKTQTTAIRWLFAWAAFVFVTWWLLTHRIDRFWLPAMPVLALLAGVGAVRCEDKRWKIVLGTFLAVGTIYGFFVGGAAAPGKNNRYLASLKSQREDPNLSTPWAVWFNAHPPDGKMLLVGEAKAFLYDVPILYNTCWNETPLKEIMREPDIGEAFRRRGIAYVLVDWGEIRRFRSPGNYGYSDIVRPELFEGLVGDGVLQRFCPTEELEKTSTVVYRVIEDGTATTGRSSWMVAARQEGP